MNAATFQAIYPEFNGINPDSATVTTVVGYFLTDADNIISDSAFGALRDKVVGLLAAHRLALKYPVTGVLNQSVPGVLNSQSASTSGLSIGVATSAMVTGDVAYRADYARTNYGLELLTRMDMAVAPGQVTGGGAAGETYGAPNLSVQDVLPQL